jgi:hypothetical protein
MMADYVRNDSRWDSAAAAHWRRLPEAEREVWRELVRVRLHRLALGPQTVESLAAGWAHDPSMVVGEPPQYAPGPKSGPRRLFSESEMVGFPRA